MLEALYKKAVGEQHPIPHHPNAVRPGHTTPQRQAFVREAENYGGAFPGGQAEQGSQE